LWEMREFVLILGMLALVGCDQTTATVDITLPSSEPAGTTASGQASSAEGDLSPATPLRHVERFKAIGTEPFWSLEVLDVKMIYTSPENEAGIAFTSTPSTDGKLLRFSGTLQDKPVVLTIEAGTCSDGMSDRAYSHKATFTWGDRTEQGCAWRQ
jgi:uncharacterized membrane protein